MVWYLHLEYLLPYDFRGISFRLYFLISLSSITNMDRIDDLFEAKNRIFWLCRNSGMIQLDCCGIWDNFWHFFLQNWMLFVCKGMMHNKVVVLKIFGLHPLISSTRLHIPFFKMNKRIHTNFCEWKNENRDWCYSANSDKDHLTIRIKLIIADSSVCERCSLKELKRSL